MLDLAFNEIEGMVRLAARGMGAPWGMADDAARLAVWLARRGLPFAAPILAQEGCAFTLPVNLLPAKGEVIITGPTSGLALACLMMDMPALETGRFSDVAGPALLLPALALRPSGGVIVSPQPGEWPGVLSGNVIIAPGNAAEFPLKARGQASRREWEALGALAHRTYVPMSAASRLAGAGAGTSDND